MRNRRVAELRAGDFARAEEADPFAVSPPGRPGSESRKDLTTPDKRHAEIDIDHRHTLFGAPRTLYI